MRLDKYLKVSRLIKRRTVAKDASSLGHIYVGGKPQKPSYEVKIGDIITIKFGLKTVKVKVLMTDNPRKDDLIYELIEESKTTS